MTVKELIEKLQKFDCNLPVVINDYDEPDKQWMFSHAGPPLLEWIAGEKKDTEVVLINNGPWWERG